MKKKKSGELVYSPSDLVRYLASPFASWMDRYCLENPGAVMPDEATEDEKLIAQTGEEHEQAVLGDLKSSAATVIEIAKKDSVVAWTQTLSAISGKAPIIYQAALESGSFSGFADFLILDDSGRYQVWDTKLARSPKPYYAVQLCCYSEMLADATGAPMPEKFGIILGTKERVEFRVEDFIHYYRRLKASFLAMLCRTASPGIWPIAQSHFRGLITAGGRPMRRNFSTSRITSSWLPESRSARSRSSSRRGSPQ